ncbi:MAG: hypothetical protein RBS78_08740 [Coriobacteriia bacterium]|nr:hypothetical protein [Coriobacteriia bacterium]
MTTLVVHQTLIAQGESETLAQVLDRRTEARRQDVLRVAERRWRQGAD